jgi:MoaA/NifB/PqqE/SkfB family radical SAM enzyme
MIDSSARIRRLRALLRGVARRVGPLVQRLDRRPGSLHGRRWVAHAFRDFIAIDGNRQAMLASLTAHRSRLVADFEKWLGGGAGDTLTSSLLNACSRIDDGNVWHSELKFRSYVDVSIQVKALRIFVDDLSRRSEATRPVLPLELTALLLEHNPSSRVALLVHADLLLCDGDADAAIDAIQRALRIQAVCVTAQHMLFRAYAVMREQGSTAPELNVLDYDLSDKFCHLPFTHMSTSFQGSTHACSCPAWVPFSIGNILKAKSAGEVWNSDVAAEIRRSVLDGDFSYCSRTQCSFITAQKLPRKSDITNPVYRGYIENHTTRVDEMPNMVELNHDPTCNLACPSCRTEIVTAKSDEVDGYAQATERVILPLLKKVNGHTYITGGGEAFASKHFRSILRALNREEYPGLYVYLITNGQLITPYRWSEFPNLSEMLAIVSVSIDAARAETYEKLRRPGKWEPLMKNLEFIAGMRRRDQIRRLGLNFVVQKENFREMLDFVALGDRLGADQIWFQRVVNYGVYDEAAFAEVNVTSPSHADHAELLQILRNPILERPSINMHMLLSLLPERVASDERLEFLY